MQPQGLPGPSPQKGLSTLTIVLIVIAVLAAFGLGTCVIGFLWVKREAKVLETELADGAVIVLGAPPDVTAALAGSKKGYVGSWASKRGSTLSIDAAGNMDFEKDEDGDGQKETFKAPIAAFHGDDLEVRMVVTMTVRVTTAPHQVGGHWEMTADGISLQRAATP